MPAFARNLGDMVLERADSIDSNAYDIATGQREVISRDDTGSSHQKHALGKAVVSEEELDQILRVALEFRDCGAPREDGRVLSRDLQVDGGVARRIGRKQDRRTKRAASVVYLRLR